jgi:hypothetical protein
MRLDRHLWRKRMHFRYLWIPISFPSSQFGKLFVLQCVKTLSTPCGPQSFVSVITGRHISLFPSTWLLPRYHTLFGISYSCRALDILTGFFLYQDLLLDYRYFMCCFFFSRIFHFLRMSRRSIPPYILKLVVCILLRVLGQVQGFRLTQHWFGHFIQ